jgi:hypothetical protein
MVKAVDVKLNPGYPLQKILFTCKLDLNLRKKLMKWCIWCIAVYGTEIDTLQKINQKCNDSFESGTGEG